jgi:hypothetical protein
MQSYDEFAHDVGLSRQISWARCVEQDPQKFESFSPLTFSLLPRTVTLGGERRALWK